MVFLYLFSSFERGRLHAGFTGFDKVVVAGFVVQAMRFWVRL